MSHEATCGVGDPRLLGSTLMHIAVCLADIGLAGVEKPLQLLAGEDEDASVAVAARPGCRQQERPKRPTPAKPERRMSSAHFREPTHCNPPRGWLGRIRYANAPPFRWRLNEVGASRE